MIYIFIAIIILYYTYIHDIKKVYKNKKIHLKFLILILFFLTGLRHGNGGDTYQYRIFWELLPTFKDGTWKELTSYRYEMGWVLTSFIIKSTLGSFVYYQLLISALINIGLYKILKKYAKYPFATMLLFFIAGEQFFWIEFEFMRQTVSVGIFLIWGVKYLEERKIFKYLITICICVLFHFSSAFLFIFPFFWYIDFNNRKTRRRIAIALPLFLLLTIIIFNYLPTGMSHAFDRFESGLDNMKLENSKVTRLFHVLYYKVFYYTIILIGWLIYKVKIKFQGALLIGVLICIIQPYITGTGRLMFFLFIIIDIALADVFIRISNRNADMFICLIIVYIITSNILFYRRYSDPHNTFFLYPYYSWFEEEPVSHKREFTYRKTVENTIEYQIYDKHK